MNRKESKPFEKGAFETLFQKILRKDSSKRITLEEIFGDPWVTKNGQEIIEPDQVQHFNNGFIGNVDRLIRMNSIGQVRTPIRQIDAGVSMLLRRACSSILHLKKNETLKLL